MAIADVPVILDLIHRTPEVQSRIDELEGQGLDETMATLQFVRERANIISEATQVDEYFCRPVGNEELLERVVEGTDMSVGQLNVRRRERLKELKTAGRVIRPEDDRQVVLDIYNAGPCQMVIVPAYIDQLFIPNNGGSRTWMKRGPVLEVSPTGTIEEQIQHALREGWTDDFDLHRAYRGIRFQGHSTNNTVHRFFSFHDIVRGELLCAGTKHTTITLRSYDGSMPILQGRKIHVDKIPRFSEQVSSAANKVTIGSLPIYERGQMEPVSLGFDVQWESNNARNTVSILRYEPGRNHRAEEIEDQATHHVVLAYLRIKKTVEPELPGECRMFGDDLSIQVPFPRPDVKTLRYFWQILQKVRVEHFDDEKQRTVLRPPTDEQVCYLLSKGIGSRVQDGQERVF
jgi:hypothetical protein